MDLRFNTSLASALIVKYLEISALSMENKLLHQWRDN